jgi:methylenetetrahydrofolate dehydrogenase (NADP+)/methenyltetrahydrofolate cyclohydrolase
MSAELLDGRPVARELRERARAELARYANAYGDSPRIAVVLVGDDPSAAAYRDAIARAAAGIELPCDVIELPSSVKQTRLLEVVADLNRRTDVHGCLFLQPLPPHLSRDAVAGLLDPLKDIDGITTLNAGRLFQGDRDVLAPSTPAGGMALLKHYNVPIAGQLAVVLGRSPVVGKPMAALLLAENATVAICHSRTRDLARITREADILVAGVGKAGVVTGEMVKPGATVLDFGVNFLDGRMVGDADAESVAAVAGRLTPTPGGAGRVTTIVLLRNTIKAATLQQRRRAGDEALGYGSEGDIGA